MDVNDVSYSLVKVIEQRRAEDTWHIDSFGGVSAAPTRPPDEVRSFCCSYRMFCSDSCCLCTRPSYCALISVNQ